MTDLDPHLHVEPAAGNPLCWFTIGVPIGGVADPLDLEGFTRHTVELARRGAGGMDRAAFDAAVDQLGAALDMEIDRDWLALSATCLDRNLDATVALATAVLRDPTMDAHEHEVLRRETMHELDDLRDDDGILTERHFQRFASPGHSYGRTIIGTEDSVERFDLGAARRHHDRLWTEANLVIGIAGSVTPERARGVAGAFRAATAGRPSPAPVELHAPAPPPGRRLYVIDKPQRTQCQIFIGHLAPRYGSEDFTALLPVETAFGGLFSSRLMQEIRVSRGWSYGAGCRMFRSRAPHWFRISLAPTREVAVPALALTLELYDKLAEGGITAEELDMAVRHLTGGLPFVQATARQRMRLAVRHELLGLPIDTPAELGRRLTELDLETVRAAAARWLRPHDVCITMVATADEVVPELERAGLPVTEVIPFDSY